MSVTEQYLAVESKPTESSSASGGDESVSSVQKIATSVRESASALGDGGRRIFTGCLDVDGGDVSHREDEHQ